MKKWPKDKSEVVSFPDLMDPLHDLMLRVLDKPEEDHKYSGYGVPSFIGATCPAADQCGKKEFRDYSLERDRDVYEIFLQAAFHLGMAQGYRQRQSGLKFAVSRLESLMEDDNIDKYQKVLIETILCYVKDEF